MKRTDKVLIFCATRKMSEEMSNTLNREGFQTVAINGDKSQKERDRVMEKFKQNKARILVATDVVSRGLDIKDVTVVINFDFPKVIDDYVSSNYFCFFNENRKIYFFFFSDFINFFINFLNVNKIFMS